MELVLSLFPGIDLLGHAFEHSGFSVVRGPDKLWDAQIEDFHVPSGRFDGVIGGPPCQQYSDANRFRNPDEGDRLLREFLRVVREADPEWCLMENVRAVPNVLAAGYHVQRLDLTDCECGGKQRRLRHIQFGSRDYWPLIIRPVRTNDRRPVTPAVTCAMNGTHDRHCRRVTRQGLLSLPLKALTRGARSRAIGNAVPWLMGLALARAIAARGPVTESDCICLCGRPISPPASHASAACRKRMERRRRGHIRTVTESATTSQPEPVTPTAAESQP